MKNIFAILFITSAVFNACGPNRVSIKVNKVKAPAAAIIADVPTAIPTLQPSPANASELSAVGTSTTQIDLSWVAGAYNSGYQIVYQAGSTAPPTCNDGSVLLNTHINGTTAIVAGLAADTSYSFRLCSQNANAVPNISSGITATAITLQEAPPNVISLSASASSDTTIVVSWASGGGSTTEYKVSYASGATAPATCAAGIVLTSNQISETTGTITELAPDTQYSFRVCSINGNTSPDISDGTTVSATTIKAAPTGLSALSAATSMTVSWNSVAGATNYAIYYATTSPINKTTATRIVTAASPYQITPLAAATTYYTNISTIVGSVESNLADNEVTAHTPPTTPTAWLMSSPNNGATSNDGTPNISSSGLSSLNGGQALVYSDSGCTTQIGSASIVSGAFSVTNITFATNGSADGVKNFYGRLSDTTGALSAGCTSLSLSYTLDTTPPDSFTVSGITGGTYDLLADAYLSDGNIPAVTWVAATGASSYDIVVRDENNTTNVCSLINIAPATSYTLAACTLVQGTSYKIRVTAKDSLGNSIEASNSPFSFSVHQLVVSSTNLRTTGTFSFVDLDVDWTRSLAYTASRFTSECMNAIDFSNPAAVSIIKTVNTTSTPAVSGTTCLGVKLFNNGTNVALSTYGANKLQVIDLGATPSSGNWTVLGTSPNISGARRIAYQDLGSGVSRFVVGQNTNVSSYTFNGSAFTLEHSYTNATCGNMNAPAIIGSYMTSFCSNDAKNIELINISSGVLSSTINNSGVTPSYGWTASYTPDYSLAFIAGTTATILENVSDTISAKIKVDNLNLYRASDYVEIDGKKYFVAVTGDKFIDVYDVTDLNNITMPYRTSLQWLGTGSNEGYGLKANAAARKIIVVTNGGYFVILNFDGLTAATITHPTF